jgi:carboxyl-terminal processing protease
MAGGAVKQTVIKCCGISGRKRNYMRKRLFVFVFCALLGVLVSYSITPVRAAVDKTYDQLRLLIDVMGLINEAYVEPRENKELLTGAINGMVKTLDPFSQYMEPKAYKEMKTETDGEFGGLGIRISIKNEWLTVITPIPGTPAYKAGVLPEDRIVKVDGKNIHGISIEDAVEKLRGAPGSKVTVSIMREGAKEPVDYTMAREIIKIETIRSRMIDGEIGYIQLTEFNANSEKDLSKALAALQKQGMKSLVFDLRNNPGGLLDVAVDVCREFVGDGKLIVYTQGRQKETRRDYLTQGKAPYGKLPMMILVNRGSASGSEIVAGAMQDLKRALILGTTTFGKGSVQSIFPFQDGSALRLTTAKYYTPSGRSIHRDEKTGTGGILPDILVEVSRETEAKLYMQSEQVFTNSKSTDTGKKQERVEDAVLEKAVELLKTRQKFAALKEE